MELCYVLNGWHWDNPRVEVYEVVKWSEATVLVRQRSGTTRIKLVTDHHQVYRSMDDLLAACRKIRADKIMRLEQSIATLREMKRIKITRISGEQKAEPTEIEL